jgi:zinc protease
VFNTKRTLYLVALALLVFSQGRWRLENCLCATPVQRADQKSVIGNQQSAIGNSQPVANSSGVTEFRLENGLKVLLREIHTTPLVSVGCWYRVGSKDEQIGTSGMSHWVEHMNFRGTQNLSGPHMARLIEDSGGYWNGYTFLDQTAYFETVVANGLEGMLRLEAERMSASLFDPAEVATERTVVISELQEAENSPKNLLERDVTAAALKIHPYRWPTEGWLQDLQNLNRDQLFQHYKHYYTPNNAILVVVGDFDTPTALDMIRKQFASIPRKPDLVRRKILEPEQEGERRIKIVREGTTPYLQIAYRAPDILSDDFYTFLILDAVLTGTKGMNLWSSPLEANAGKSSRLYRALIDKKFATYVGSALLPTQDPFLYILTITLPDTFQFQPAEEVVYDELEKLKNYGITNSESDKAKNQLLARTFLDQDTISKLAHQLGYFESIASHQFLTSLEDKIAQVSQDDLRRVAVKYFSDRARTVGWFVPLQKQPTIGVEKLTGEKRNEEVERTRRVAAYPGLRSMPLSYPERPTTASLFSPTATEVRAPQIVLKLKQRVLSNGVLLVAAENHTSPTITIRASVKAGTMRDDDERVGIAHFVGAMLEHGTKTRSVREIAERFEFLGANLSIETDYLLTSLLVNGLKKDAESFMALMAEMLQAPSFPQVEIEKVRAELLTQVREEMDDPAVVAEQVLRERIYPRGHPFGRKIKGSPQTLEKIKAADLLAFHKRFYRPDQLIITIAGDIDPEEIASQAEKHFGSWSMTGSVEAFAIPPAPAGSGEGKQVVTMRAKSQCDIVLGVPGISIRSPDYFPLLILNRILGQAGLGGRLGMRIREQEGLAYDVSSSFDASLAEGLFVVRAGAAPEHVDRVITLMKEEIDKVRTHGITEQEIMAAKQYLINSIPLQLESNEGITGQLERIQLFQLGDDYLTQYPDSIAAVTMDRLLDCARTRLTFDRGALVVAGPYEAR